MKKFKKMGTMILAAATAFTMAISVAPINNNVYANNLESVTVMKFGEDPQSESIYRGYSINETDFSVDDIVVTPGYAGGIGAISFTVTPKNGAVLEKAKISKESKKTGQYDNSFIHDFVKNNNDLEPNCVNKGTDGKISGMIPFIIKEEAGAGINNLCLEVTCNGEAVPVIIPYTVLNGSFNSGNAVDIKLKDVKTVNFTADSQAAISFDVVCSPGGQWNKIYPKPDASGPFVMDDGMHEILNRVDDHVEFFFNIKKDVKTGYYPITFDIVYDGDEILEKTVDIYIVGKEGETTADDTNKSVPRIMVTGYETNPTKVMAGQEFELTVHLQNTSNRTAVSNVKVTLSTAGNEFLPTSGSSTEFIRSIGCGATKDIVIKMQAQANLEQKPYVLAVACEYEGEKNAPYTATENISIPVYQESKAKITDVEVNPSAVEVYNQASVMFSINNTGRTTLYNVQVAVDKNNPFVKSEESFVGNINAGSTGYADFMVTGVAPTTDDGNVKIIVTYEDAAGETGTFETEVNLFVFEAVYNDPGFIEDFPIDMEQEKPSTPWGLIVAAIVAALAVVGTIVTVIVKKKKRKELEEDLEDEIS